MSVASIPTNANLRKYPDILTFTTKLYHHKFFNVTEKAARYTTLSATFIIKQALNLDNLLQRKNSSNNIG